MKVLYEGQEIEPKDFDLYIRTGFDEEGNVIVRKKTRQELNEPRIGKIKARLVKITEDFAQVQAGLVVPDIEDKKIEFQKLLNEIRELEGKEPRKIKDKEG